MLIAVLDDCGTGEDQTIAVALKRLTAAQPESDADAGGLQAHRRVFDRSALRLCLQACGFVLMREVDNHPVMHTLYDVKDVEQVSNIRFWMQTNGNVSERGSDSPQVNFRGIQDTDGRLMVVMAHNTDIPDTWEREGESKEYFDRFSPAGYAIGVNIIVYALTH